MNARVFSAARVGLRTRDGGTEWPLEVVLHNVTPTDKRVLRSLLGGEVEGPALVVALPPDTPGEVVARLRQRLAELVAEVGS